MSHVQALHVEVSKPKAVADTAATLLPILSPLLRRLSTGAPSWNISGLGELEVLAVLGLRSLLERTAFRRRGSVRFP